MMFARLPYASRQTAAALVWLLLCGGTVLAREFTVQTLSETGGDARHPSIGDSGLVAWQGFSKVEGGQPTAQRSDIFLWQDGRISNITANDPRIAGRSERPRVFRDSVLFTTRFNAHDRSGYPFDLSIPPKTEEMRQMESEYPTLFDPPLPAPRSAVEAEGVGDETPPATPLDPADMPAASSDGSSLQRQMWRGSGAGLDVAVYRPDNTIERITPGSRHFSFPVMSDAGIAFQVARGWPYGYEVLVWEPGDTALTQLTTNYFYVLNPDIHGNELVFQAWDGNDYEIFRYRFDTGEMEQVTNNQFDDTHPVVWNGEIAWIAHPTVNAEIFHMRDGVIRKISETSQDNSAPSIWEGRVVWQGYDDTDLEIYYFNGRRTIKLTSNTWDDIAPQVRDGVIAWMSYVGNGDAEIMALDLSDNITVQLTDNDWEDSFPQTMGEKIVWYTLLPEGAQVQMAEPSAPRAADIN
jgi:hypothetical protein